MAIMTIGTPGTTAYSAPTRSDVPASGSPQPKTDSVRGSQPAAPSASPKEQDIKEAVQTLNDSLMTPPMEVRYAMNEKANRTVITIVNTQSGEVLRQIPDITVIHLAEAVNSRLATAHLVDEKA
jgi:flagellar protein FlaG